MNVRSTRLVLGALGGALGLFLAGSAVAADLDLTTRGSSGWVNGAYFEQIDPRPTGTGYIDPFVRIQANGEEQGYNSDGRPIQFDEKAPANYNHSVLLADVGVEVRGGVAYRVFMLDINEPNGRGASLLSMDELEIYLGSAGNFTQFDPDGHTFVDPGAVSVLVYDLDGAGDSTVELDYDLNTGSGSGDLMVYVPDALFTRTAAPPYVYLYSKFGNPNSSGDGFEEWWHAAAPKPPPIPEPGTLILLAIGTLGAAARARAARG